MFFILSCVIYLSTISFTKTITHIQAKVLPKNMNKLQLNLELKHILVAEIKKILTFIHGK